MWISLRHQIDEHVMPVNDLRDHEITLQCWCCPTEDDECPGLFVHHAMDQREQFENGERVAS